MAVNSTLTIHQHNAEKAGLHYDIRILMPNGIVQSFALPKAKLPTEKNKYLAIKTHESDTDALNFQGEISDGYGKGIIKILDKIKIKLLEVSDEKIVFQTMEDRKEHLLNGRYFLVHTKQENFIFGKSKI